MNLSLRGSRRSLIRFLLAGLCLGAVAGMTACSGGAVGGGNAPRRIVIAASGATTELPTLRGYRCLTYPLRALLFFDDGSVGDFTNRVVWSTNNPGAARVSNADIETTGGFFTNGVVVPSGEGNAIITADYFGIVSQIAVSVSTPLNITLKAVVDGNYAPLARINPNRSPDDTAFTMAPGTSQTLAVTAFLDGFETDITKYSTLGFQVPNSGVASMNSSTSSIVAGAGGGPVIPQATFSTCDLNTSTTDPNKIVRMSVSPATAINMQPEFLPDQTQPISSTNALPALIVGNSEEFKVIASLANGDTQDVSSQSNLSVAQNTSVAQFGGASGINNLLFASAAGGPVIVQANFQIGGALLNAPTIVTGTRTAVLSTYKVCWTDVFTDVKSCPSSQPAPFVQAGSLTPLKFHAIGDYGVIDPNTNQELLQDVTRGTTWTSTDQTIATISNAPLTAGEAIGQQQGAATIQVVNSSAVNVPQQFIQLNVNPQQ